MKAQFFFINIEVYGEFFSGITPTDKHTTPNIEFLFAKLRKQVVYFLHERTLIN